MKSNNFHMGISLLEHDILTLQKSQRQASDPKKHEKPIAKRWHQLGLLYRLLGEDDIHIGIFQHVSSLQETKDALQNESSGDFNAALKIYDGVLEQLDKKTLETPVSKLEVLFSSFPPSSFLTLYS